MRYLLLCMLAHSFAQASEPETLYFTTGQWPPYIDREQTDQGCVARFIRDIFATQNYQVRFVFMPWKRTYQEGQKAEFSGSAYWYDNKQRRQDYLFPDYPLTKETAYFYASKKAGFDWHTYPDLKGYRLLLNNGFTYPDALLEAIANENIATRYITYANKNMRLLLLGRDDVTVMTEQSADTYLAALPQQSREQLVRHPRPAYTSLGYLMINRQHPELVLSFNRGYRALSEDPVYMSDYRKNCSQIP